MNPLALARALYDDGRYRESIEEARRVLSEVLTVDARLRCLFLIGSNHWELRERDECLATIADAGSLLDDAPLELRGNFYGQRALLYRNAGEYDQSLIDYAEALHWAIEAGDRECEARVRNNVAKIHSDQGNLTEALKENKEAIRIVTELNDTVLAGRFYDMRAQIYLAHGQHEESLKAGCEALRRLRGHATSIEAQETHARALNEAVSFYLAENDPVRRFNLRRVIVNGLATPLDPEIILIALRRTDGHVFKAAKLLNVRHQSIQPIIEQSGLSRRPKRRRQKSLIKA
jgi:tetratricopeptide (TPR) repeat protein